MEQIVTALKPLFDHINDQFAKIDGRFDQIDQRFEKMDQRFDQIDGQFAKVHEQARRTAIEVANLKTDSIDMRLEMATKRDLSAVDRRLMDFISEIQNSRNERILAEMSYQKHEEKLQDHEKRLANLEERPDPKA